MSNLYSGIYKLLNKYRKYILILIDTLILLKLIGLRILGMFILPYILLRL